jgi:hypothetical protein
MEFIKFEPFKLYFFGKEYLESSISYTQRMDERLTR